MNPHPRDPTESCPLCPEQVTPHPHQCGHPTCPSSPRASLPNPVTSAALHSAGSALGQRPPALNGDPPRKHRTRPWDQRCFPPPRDGADPRLGPRSLQGRLVCHSRALDRPRDGRALAVPSPSLPVLAPSGPASQAPRPRVRPGASGPGGQGPPRPWPARAGAHGCDAKARTVPSSPQQPRPHGHACRPHLPCQLLAASPHLGLGPGLGVPRAREGS